jgi:quinolinate synthase
LVETVVLPDNGALKEADLDPKFDHWAGIERLRREKNAIILAHYYQDGEIQDLADFVGDSLDLSRRAADTDADMIVFCGVRFMAEGAKILNPDKIVVLPDADAGCSLEDVCQADDFARFRAEHPDHIAITYINCSAEVKALSDIIVTSSNAEYIINQLPKNQPILFAPDRHLGAYLAQKTGREMTLWDGTCIVHDRFSVRELVKLKAAHPDALVTAHPECSVALLEHADHIGSTRAILEFVTKSPAPEFIVATERHIIHQMEKAAPSKTFIAAPGADGGCSCADCPFMELNTVEKIYLAMENETPRIEISEDLRRRALIPLEKMLEMSPPAKAITQAAE